MHCAAGACTTLVLQTSTWRCRCIHWPKCALLDLVMNAIRKYDLKKLGSTIIGFSTGAASAAGALFFFSILLQFACPCAGAGLRVLAYMYGVCSDAPFACAGMWVLAQCRVRGTASCSFARQHWASPRKSLLMTVHSSSPPQGLTASSPRAPRHAQLIVCVDLLSTAARPLVGFIFCIPPFRSTSQTRLPTSLGQRDG